MVYHLRFQLFFIHFRSHTFVIPLCHYPRFICDEPGCIIPSLQKLTLRILPQLHDIICRVQHTYGIL